MKYGVLLVNTGSPDSCKTEDIKKYLGEFLMDERVIDINLWKRKILVNGIIVPFRAKKTARMYSRIWTEKGSPLLQITNELADQVEKISGQRVYYAMRYGSPAIRDVLHRMCLDGINRIILIPMFPHYAMSTYESVVVKVMEEYAKFSFNNLIIIPPYYRNPEFILAIADNAAPYLKEPFDCLIFSYHSLPNRHIEKMDRNKSYCLKAAYCCDVDNPVHDFCYRAQTFKTTKILIEKMGLKGKKTFHSYQSAMNKKTWLGPDTESVIAELARSGAKKIIVMCPGFVTDNLETLDEIKIRYREVFLKNGGDSLVYIPSLNAGVGWANTLSKWIQNEVQKPR